MEGVLNNSLHNIKFLIKKHYEITIIKIIRSIKQRNN
jgi:hypothetical protein